MKTILIADDDEHTRNLLRELCVASGYQVIVCVDGVDALEKLAVSVPDLVLLDLMMPRKDGFTVLGELRQTARLTDLPVVVLTAMGDMDGKIRAMELGADDYITKPFKLIELQTRVNSAIIIREYKKKLQAAEEELAHLRALDPISGAGTYSHLKATLEAEFARAARYNRPLAALVFGFDDYQGLRYQLGRPEFDQFIGTMANRIRSLLRGADRLFRMEVDEFVILLPETDFAGAHGAGERLENILHTLLGEQAKDLQPQFRIGGAAFPHSKIQSSEELLREANRSFQLLREDEQGKSLFDLTE